MKVRTQTLYAAIALPLVLACSDTAIQAASGHDGQSPFGPLGGFSQLLNRLPTSASEANHASAHDKSAATSPANIAADPRIITIDIEGSSIVQPVSINDMGTISGTCFLDAIQMQKGFIREPDGRLTTFTPPGSGIGAFAWSINGAGEITGDYADQNGVVHGFLRSREGRFTTFDPPGAGTIPFVTGTASQNINSSGETAGTYGDNASVFHGFVRFPDGVFETFDVPGAGTGPNQGTFTASSDGLNSEGDLAGWFVDDANVYHSYVRFRDGTIITFNVSGSGTAAFQGNDPAGINDRGEIIGVYTDGNNVNHGFIRSPEGRLKTLDLSGAGTGPGQGTVTENINAEGDTAGFYIDAIGIAHGFVRHHDGGISTIDAAGVGTANGQGTFPIGNNARGAVTGHFVDADSNWHGFLRTP
jgi:hypothetical protein